MHLRLMWQSSSPGAVSDNWDNDDSYGGYTGADMVRKYVPDE